MVYLEWRYTNREGSRKRWEVHLWARESTPPGTTARGYVECSAWARYALEEEEAIEGVSPLHPSLVGNGITQFIVQCTPKTFAAENYCCRKHLVEVVSFDLGYGVQQRQVLRLNIYSELQRRRFFSASSSRIRSTSASPNSAHEPTSSFHSSSVAPYCLTRARLRRALVVNCLKSKLLVFSTT